MDDLRWVTQLTLPGDKSAFDKLTRPTRYTPHSLLDSWTPRCWDLFSSAMAIAIRNKSHPRATPTFRTSNKLHIRLDGVYSDIS